MASLVIPNAAVLRLIWSVGGTLTAINVMGAVNSGNIAITQALANTLGTAIKGAVGTSGLAANIATTFALNNIGLRDIRTANQPEFLDSGAAQAGAATGDLLPPQTCLCITLRTALSGHSYRGRVYLSGFTETGNTPGGASTGAGSCAAFITAVKSALVSSGLDLGVMSRPQPQLPVPKAGWITPVSTIVARDSVWDTQRRRAIPGV